MREDCTTSGYNPINGVCGKYHKSPKLSSFTRKTVFGISVQVLQKQGFKPQSHIHDFGPGRATIHPDLSNRDASA